MDACERRALEAYPQCRKVFRREPWAVASLLRRRRIWCRRVHAPHSSPPPRTKRSSSRTTARSARELSKLGMPAISITHPSSSELPEHERRSDLRVTEAIRSRCSPRVAAADPSPIRRPLTIRCIERVADTFSIPNVSIQPRNTAPRSVSTLHLHSSLCRRFNSVLGHQLISPL